MVLKVLVSLDISRTRSPNCPMLDAQSLTFRALNAPSSSGVWPDVGCSFLIVSPSKMARRALCSSSVFFDGPLELQGQVEVALEHVGGPLGETIERRGLPLVDLPEHAVGELVRLSHVSALQLGQRLDVLLPDVGPLGDDHPVDLEGLLRPELALDLLPNSATTRPATGAPARAAASSSAAPASWDPSSRSSRGGGSGKIRADPRSDRWQPAMIATRSQLGSCRSR
jgi:hypothetical protein